MGMWTVGADLYARAVEAHGGDSTLWLRLAACEKNAGNGSAALNYLKTAKQVSRKSTSLPKVIHQKIEEFDRSWRNEIEEGSSDFRILLYRNTQELLEFH